MQRLWVFNPGHEEALRHRAKASYNPSRLVRQMMCDLPQLMCLLAQEGDYIYAPSLCGQQAQLLDHRGIALDNYSQVPCLRLEMWAWEHHLAKQVERWALRQGLTLTYPNISSEYYALSHRQASNSYLKNLANRYPHLIASTDIIPSWHSHAESLYNRAQSLYNQGFKQLVVKLPYSSSGRGVLVFPNPLEAKAQALIKLQINKHGSVSIEPYLNKKQDYASLWYIDREGIRPLGFSKFYTKADQHNTAYAGNYLLTDKDIETELIEAVGSVQDWEYLQNFMHNYLWKTFGTYYEGHIGVDMMSYRSANGALCLHPCVEINLRCTMGVLAHSLSKALYGSSSLELSGRACKDLLGQGYTGYYELLYLPGTWQGFEGFLSQLSTVNHQIYTEPHLLTQAQEGTQFIAYYFFQD